MSDPTLVVNTVIDSKGLIVPYTPTTTAEDVCVHVCEILNIGPLARHLFALRVADKNVFYTPSACFTTKYSVFDLRIRYKVSRLHNLRKLDLKAYDYYFHQTRLDVLENRIPDIIFDKCKRELIGLGITDMYRVILEKDISKETVVNDYKKYIPKEVLKKHSFFIKKPIRETLVKLQKTKHDIWFIKEEYMNQLNIIAPEYLSETYKAVIDQDGSVYNILIKVSPDSSSNCLPEIKYCFDNKIDQWQSIGTIEDVAFISIQIEGTVEICRSNGVPFYLKFNSLQVMWSFISHLDGYYRLACKWTFNICKDAPTPSLQKLYMMKCHGPVGGEFSYAKLEQKRSNRPGCFIIRESETKYNQYFIDVCMKDSSKPKTFKLEKINKDEYIFNDDLTIYKSIQQIIAAYSDPNGAIYLQECLPPSEYDKSQLLLCQREDLSGSAVADAASLTSLVPNAPLCIDCRDLQVYKRTYCYVLDYTEGKILKKYCRIRICKSKECRMAGTGNDYSGTLNITRSRRYCEPWISNFTHLVHPHPFGLMNESNFPDLSVENASNFCRNPSRNSAGSWCYTIDPIVPMESCAVRDCDKPDACIITIGGKNEVHKKDGFQGLTSVHRSMWKIMKNKKIEVAMKVLKKESCDKYLKDFLDLAGNWAFLQSKNIVRLYGVTLTINISMVMEYFRLGPLNEYLRKNRNIIKTVDLIEASSNLASALWYMSEKQLVHGNIRCRKLMLNSHDDNSFTIKLSDPGIRTCFGPNEVYWIPIECYHNFEFARRSTTADVWAFATTLWEIFAFGEEFNTQNPVEVKQLFKSGKVLPKPPMCPDMIYQVMKECWMLDFDRRKQPQAIMRDINQIMYQVYNSRRIHSYAKVFTKKPIRNQNMSGTSSHSMFSNKTDSTVVSQNEDLLLASGDDGSLSVSSSYSGRLSECALLNSNDLYEETFSCDFSNILSNFNFSTATTSLDSLQSIFELDGCNVVLQGRIGQGFYGEVYKATLEYYDNESDKTPRQVAVKKLKTSGMSSSLQDFEREISIMKTLKHPNIVEILGVVRDPEILLVMEFVQHGSLQSYLKIYRESLYTKQLLKYSLDIAKGMQYLGKKNIVHRDLAARNILVVDENHVKISDFGLAQVMGTNDYYILKTNRELPIKWYAPESLRDGKFSVRSDVWSYGVTMCEMFNCGEEPKLANIDQDEEKGQEQEVLLKALAAGARFPCPPMCPKAVYLRIIYPCWQNDPHARPSFEKLVTENEDLVGRY